VMFMNQQGALAQSGNFEKAMSSFPEFSKLLSGISGDTSKVDLQNDSKKTQSVLSGSQSGINPTQAKEIIEQHGALAQSGNFGKSMGSYSEMANLAAKSSSDFDNMSKLAGNSTVMPSSSPNQAKQTIDSYGGLAQSGNFDKFMGSFSETSKYASVDTSTSTPSQNITATKPNNDKNTADMATAAAKKTLDSYGQLLQSGNFDSKFNPYKDIPAIASAGTRVLGSAITSAVSGQYEKVMGSFPELTNLFAKTATSQTVFTNTNISTIKDQLSGQQLAQSEADKNLEFVNSRQQRIKGITDNLITKGIAPTQKSFKMLSTLLELRIPSTGVAEAGGSGKMGGLSSLANRAKSLFGGSSGGGAPAGGGSSGGGSASGASTSGGSAGGSSGGSSGSSSGGSSGSSSGGSSGSSSGGSSGSSSSGSVGGSSSAGSTGASIGNASNAMQLNAGGTGSVAGGTAETEKAGGLAEGTGPTTVGQNQQLLLQAMNELGVTDPKIRASMAAAAEGESGFKMQSEIGYENTSNENIRKSFGAGSIFGKMPDDELTKLKADPVKFFDYVYGDKNPAFKGYGNDQPGDGYKYRGRGFIGITFKTNYKKYGEKLGIDLVANPDLANDPKIAAKIAVMMMLDGMKRNPNADPYTQVARSIGNSNAVTEQRKKDAYARNMESGQFGAEKVADLSFMKKGGGAATQTASATGPTQVAQADTKPTPVAPVDSSRSQGKLEQAEGGGVFAEGYKSVLGEGPEANILLPDGKGIPVDLKQEESDEGDDSDMLAALQLQKIQVLGTITDAMAKGAELSRQLLQLQS
jgi:predicted chitinase